MNRRVGAAPKGDPFSDRVMAAIALVASPSPTRSFLEAVRSGSGRDAAAALAVAWHLATAGDPVGARVRARSLALVIAVASILASGSMVAASAARVIVPHVDRSRILVPNGSVIVDAGPDSVERIRPDLRHPALATVVAPVVVVVSKKTDPSVGQTGGDGHGPASAAAPTHGTTSVHAPRPAPGASDDGDSTHGSGQGHDASDDGGHDQGHDGTDAGATVDGSADGGDENHHGDSGSDGGDDHEAGGQGDPSGG